MATPPQKGPESPTSLEEEQDASNQLVLYVTSLKPCRGTRTAMDLLKTHGDPEGVVVQDVKSLREEGVELPPWLVGTPTLVHVPTRAVHRGTDALQELARHCEELEARRRSNSRMGGGDEANNDDADEEGPAPDKPGGRIDVIEEPTDWEAAKASEEIGSVKPEHVEAMLNARKEPPPPPQQ